MRQEDNRAAGRPEGAETAQRGAPSRRVGEAVLLLITAIWGSSFVMAHRAMAEGMSPLFILMCRFLLSALFLGLFHVRAIRRELRVAHLKYGLLLGAVLLLAFYFQMLGLRYTTPSNNAIITSCNVVIVPFLWWAVARRRPPRLAFLCCAISLAGVAVVSVDVSQGLGVRAGDLLSLLGALLFAAQIVCVSEMTRRVDHRVLVFLGFLVAGLLAALLLPLTGESLPRTAGPAGVLAVLYLAVVCTCVCFLLQAWAMRGVDPTRCAVIMSTEALFGSLLSVLAGIDPPSWRIAAGGLLLFLSVTLPELVRNRTRINGSR